ERKIYEIEPPGYRTDNAVASLYSEHAEVGGTIQILGGARIVRCVLYEVPVRHASDHDESGPQSVHAVSPNQQPTPKPQTKAKDGATYEEHRLGTVRMMQVAERLQERLGPYCLHWCSWNETDEDAWTDGTPAHV